MPETISNFDTPYGKRTNMKHPKNLLHLMNGLLMVHVLFLLICCKQDANNRVSQNYPVENFNVDELMQASTSNKSGVKEQIVMVEGYIYDINHVNNRNTILLSGEKGENASVICDMQNSQSLLLDKLEKGQFISIKGILKGSLKDVILLNCIIVKHTTNE